MKASDLERPSLAYLLPNLMAVNNRCLSHQEAMIEDEKNLFSKWNSHFSSVNHSSDINCGLRRAGTLQLKFIRTYSGRRA